MGGVNGDGHDDVTVVAFRFDSPDIDESKASLHLGSATGLQSTPAWTVEGDQAGAQLSAATPAGDVNGDGFDDVIVGIGAYDGPDVDEGRALLFLGSAAGLSTTPAWVHEGDQAGAFFGGTVVGAGDVNGDGFADVLVGAGGFDNGQVDEGMVSIFQGSASGLSTVPDWTAESDQAGSIMSRVSGPGDLNGDGFADVIIGQRFFQGTLSLQGRTLACAGSAAVLNPVPLQTFEGTQAAEESGVSVCTAGDANGDGFDDIIIGTHAYDNPELNEGRALVFHGGP